MKHARVAWAGGIHTAVEQAGRLLLHRGESVGLVEVVWLPPLAPMPAQRPRTTAWCGAVLRQNGVVEETGLAAGVQGDPAIGVAWPANKLAPWGASLEAGHRVMAGYFTRPVATAVRGQLVADDGRLGQLAFQFT